MNKIKLFLENKEHVCVHKFDIYVRIHGPAYATRVPETMKSKFSA